MSEEPEEEQVDADEATAADEDATDAEDADAAPEEEVEPTGLQPGDVIKLELTAYTVEEGILVDTTDEEVAEEEGVAEDQTFEPRVIVLGEGHLFQPVEDAVIGLEVGDTASVVVPPAEAFGEHDPGQVRTVSVDKIDDDNRYPGAFVEIDGQRGFIETIIGGRARVDFNHPFAGDEIEYELEVIEELDDREELAQGLIQTFLDLELECWFQTDEVEVVPEPDDDEDAEDVEPEVESVESLYIEATPQLTMNQQWLFGKQQIATSLIDQLDVDRVVVQEIIERREDLVAQTEQLLAEEGIEAFDEDELEE